MKHTNDDNQSTTMDPLPCRSHIFHLHNAHGHSTTKLHSYCLHLLTCGSRLFSFKAKACVKTAIRYFGFTGLLLLLSALGFIGTSCDQSTPPITTPPDTAKYSCDCVDWPYDSAAVYNGGLGGVLWDYHEYRKTPSPDGKYFSLSVFHPSDLSKASGLGVFLSSSKEQVLFIPGPLSYASWSEDSRHFVSINSLRNSLILGDAESGQYVERGDLGMFYRAVYAVGGTDVYLFGAVQRVGGFYKYDTKRDTLNAVFLDTFGIYSLYFEQLSDSSLVWLSADQELVSPEPRRVRNTIVVHTLHPETLEYRRVVGPSFVSGWSYQSSIKGQLNRKTGRYIFDAEIGGHKFGIYTLDISTLSLTYQTSEITCSYYELYPTWNGDSAYYATWFCLRDRTARIFSGSLK